MMHKKLLIAVSIPFVLLCLLIIRAEIHINQGQEWQFQVQGYDPRDLLRGHYLQFNLRHDWGSESGRTCSDANDCCLCLTDVGNRVPKVKKTSCETAQTQCDGYMRDKFVRGLNRYYIPENQAAHAEKILQDAGTNNEAFLSVSINSKGEAQITDMMIQGKSLDELIKLEEEPRQ